MILWSVSSIDHFLFFHFYSTFTDSTENGNGSHDIVIGAAVGVFAFILVLATVILVVL